MSSESGPGFGRREDGTVHAAAVCFDLHVPESRSLKTKRAAIRPIVDGLRHKYRISVAEVDHHDQWQRAAVAVAVVAESGAHLQDVLQKVRRFVEFRPDIEVLGVETVDLSADGLHNWQLEHD